MPASGPVSLATEALRELVAASSTFQTWTSTANAAAALARVHIEEGDPSATLPYAVVWDIGEIEQPMFGTIRGTLCVLFEAAVADGEEAGTAKYSFSNSVAQIVKEMMAESYNSGRLVLRGINSAGVAVRSNYSENTDRYSQTFSFQIGLE